MHLINLQYEINYEMVLCSLYYRPFQFMKYILVVLYKSYSPVYSPMGIRDDCKFIYIIVI